MLHHNINRKSGFRALSEKELKVVSGGFEEPNNFGGGHLDDYDYLAAVEFSQIYGYNGTGPDSFGDGTRFIDRLPPDESLDDYLNERERQFSYTLQAFGVPAALAGAIAVITSYLSSIEAKQDLNELVEQAQDLLQEVLFGPANESTGDPAEDIRRALGPLVGPQFPE